MIFLITLSIARECVGCAIAPGIHMCTAIATSLQSSQCKYQCSISACPTMSQQPQESASQPTGTAIGKERTQDVQGGSNLASPCVFLSVLLSVHSAAPEGCTSFSLSTPPGVLVDVVHSPPTKKSPTCSSKWPLDPRLEVSLRMKAASSSTGDQKVSAAQWDGHNGERGHSP